jgi:hypothetical protein
MTYETLQRSSMAIRNCADSNLFDEQLVTVIFLSSIIFSTSESATGFLFINLPIPELAKPPAAHFPQND